MKSLSIVVTAALVASIFGSAYAQTPATTIPTYDLLSHRRASIVFPTYSAADKQTIADQALYLIQNHYVHLAQKLTDFGVDPIADLKGVQQNATSLSDVDLHGQIESIFSKTRDLHTNYYYPAPYACYANALPISLEQVQLPSGAMAVGIAGASVSPTIVAMTPDVAKISPGDVVLSWGGVDPFVFAQKFYEQGAGANANAQVRRALELMTARSQMDSLMPTNDAEALTLVKPNGTQYSVSLPYISIADADCLNPPSHKRNVAPKKDRFLQGSDPYQLKFAKMYEQASNSQGAYIATAEPSIRYQVITNANGTFGMIKMASFEPTKSVDESIAILTDLLMNKFQNTKGVIIDLRGNGGGSLTYGERMLQLFAPKQVETEDFQMLASQGNRNLIIATGTASDFLPLIDQAIAAGQGLAGTIKLTPMIEANALGQSYLKPVVILTNSSCFSTCDSFTAGMQDNGLGTVIATDGQTGGGGANVVEYNAFAQSYPQGAVNPFLPLPGNQNMRVAWRNAVRVGKNAGVNLEDRGAVADMTIKPVLQDIISADSVLVPAITKILSDQYAMSPSANTQITLDSSARVDYLNGASLSIPAKVSGTSFVQFAANGSALDQLSVNAESASVLSTNLTVQASALATLSDLSTVELTGMLNQTDGTSASVWRKVLTVRRIPSTTAALPVQLNFATASLSPFALYKSTNGGWSVVNNTMRIGAGPNYPDDSHSEAALFLNVPAGSTAALKFTAELHSEKSYDFFKVSVFVNGVETALLTPISGDVAQQDYSYSLAAYAGKKIEIRFTFESDSGVNGPGPLISKLSVQ
jgi:C-terminal processing protease CtpA/Prc